MVYPKPYMRKRELVSMGIPSEMLDRAYRSKGQRFAQKIDPTKPNSPILFDTDGFERWRIKQMNIEQRAMI